MPTMCFTVLRLFPLRPIITMTKRSARIGWELTDWLLYAYVICSVASARITAVGLSFETSAK